MPLSGEEKDLVPRSHSVQDNVRTHKRKRRTVESQLLFRDVSGQVQKKDEEGTTACSFTSSIDESGSQFREIVPFL